MKHSSLTTAHPDHHKYIEGIRKKDRPIIEKIYSQERQRNINWVKNNSGTEDDGHDIFQDALEVVVRKTYFTPFILPCPFGIYLHGICRFLWLKELGRKRKENELIRNMEIEEHINIEAFEKLIETTVDGDRWLLLKERTFKKISGLCQKLLSMYQEGKTVKEISMTLDMEPNAIYQRRSVCMRSWRKAMENDSDFKNCNPYNL